ncbi:MAG: rRNA pseudouridine synthase [Clostridiales bacterium]|jgi:pseudouridine synthase|nr:rRNA pseudouridine synthase [Clostridiales bacterium]
MKMRLQKFLAASGVASRRHCEKLIAEGRAAVNGEVVTEPGISVDPERDTVTLDSQPLGYRLEMVYLMLNKPEGYVTTMSEQFGRPCVAELVPPGTRVVPVGRLDYDSSGLLLLTNDGDIIYKLTHPRYGVEKTYAAAVRGVPEEAALEKLRRGVLLDGRVTAPARVGLKKTRAGGPEVPAQAEIIITIHEGRNRQVRRMCEAIGHPVRALKRVAIGELKLGDLRKGEYRILSKNEIEYLNYLKNVL